MEMKIKLKMYGEMKKKVWQINLPKVLLFNIGSILWSIGSP